MGLDLILLVPAEERARWSYGGFMHFRERLCESAGMGFLREYKGFGGQLAWPSSDVQPLVTLLNHSDCEGTIAGWEAPGLTAVLRAVVRQWPEDDYDRQMGETLAAMFERAEREGGAVDFR